MKIAVDALPLISQKTGVGYYLDNILTEIINTDKNNSYYLTNCLSDANTKRVYEISALPLETNLLVKSKSIPFPFATAYQILLRLKSLFDVKLHNMDVFWGPNFTGTYDPRFKTVLTIHDMAHEYFPEMITEGMLDYLKFGLAEAARKADALIAVSQATKEDMIKFLHVPESKIKVIYNGYNDKFSRVNDEDVLEKVRQKYALPERYILFVGTVQPRKNIQRLIEAYAKLFFRNQIEHKLVVVGARGWKDNDIYALIDKLNIQSKILFTGYVDEDDLPALYSLADLFVFPSLYEGFGIPIIEAMACGVPVLTSNTSCMPEIAGNAAITVDPYSVAEIASGIYTILTNETTRMRLVDEGIKRIKRFCWKRSAKETIELFESL